MLRGDLILKKTIIISILIVIIICTIAVYTYGATGSVKVDDLRLREENSTTSKIITLLSIGDKVEIINKTENGWYKIKYKDYEGYVSADYINVQEEIAVVNQKEEIKEENKNTENSESKKETDDEITKNTTEKIISKDEKIYGVPLINANTITLAKNDTKVNILTEINGWSYIASDDLNGWVRTEKIKNTVEDKSTEKEEEKEVGYVTAATVNFRKTPSLSGEIIKTLTTNKEVTIIEKIDGWVKVEVDGTIGYVSSTYISNKKR